MESLTSLFNKEHRGELILAVLLVLYLVMGFKTPDSVANVVDTLIGKVVILMIVVYLFAFFHPILAVLALFVAFDLIRRSSQSTGISALQKYAPTEEKKSSQFSAYNQFPYTLEQEIVAKMAPVMQSGSSITQASYKPLLDNLHDASSINNSN
jgi:hypothetical protein